MLTPNVKLSAVMYIPDFHFNLVSVNKLTKDAGLVMHFTDSKCMMQDPMSSIVIAEGKAMRGLY